LRAILKAFFFVYRTLNIEGRPFMVAPVFF
jgi:hypothetical protein